MTSSFQPKRVLLFGVCLGLLVLRRNLGVSIRDFQWGRNLFLIFGLVQHFLKGFMETVLQRAVYGPITPSFSWLWEVRLGAIRSLVKWGQEELYHDARLYHSVRRLGDWLAFPTYRYMQTLHPQVFSKQMTIQDVPCEAWSCSAVKLESFYHDMTSTAAATPSAHPVVVYLHGGGFASGSLVSSSPFAIALAMEMPDVIVLLVDYRLAPETVFPAPILDVVSILEKCNQHTKSIGLCGDSAGGGLVCSTLLHLRQSQQEHVPRCAMMISPMLSQAHDQDFPVNTEFDIIQPRLAHGTSKNYCPCPQTAKFNPLASPCQETDLLTGMPPLLIHFAEKEIFAHECLQFATRAQKQGTNLAFKSFADMVHCFQILFPDLPESRSSLQEIGAFFQLHLL